MDVPLLSIRREFHDQLRPHAAGIEGIAGEDALDPADVVFLAGFPSFLSFKESADLRQFATITYATGVTGQDEHGRLKVVWDEAIPTEDAPRFPHLDLQPGVVARLEPSPRDQRRWALARPWQQEG